MSVYYAVFTRMNLTERDREHSVRASIEKATKNRKQANEHNISSTNKMENPSGAREC